MPAKFVSPAWSSCSQCRHHQLEEHASQLFDVCSVKGLINPLKAWHYCADRQGKWVKNHEALLRG